eukprot:TRINITY_DN6590_c0_g1_i1.p1 TRINITY_DN6590_c0_g1~~TRINITY_DN6590_c0_g1_i1.p1  ORF type:complete len:100 (-),score=16.14 TRINITY_DN6590_c0_g1_i1:568-867(-)
MDSWRNFANLFRHLSYLELSFHKNSTNVRRAAKLCLEDNKDTLVEFDYEDEVLEDTSFEGFDFQLGKLTRLTLSETNEKEMTCVWACSSKFDICSAFER